MLKLRERAKSSIRRSPRRMAQKRRLNVETLECRALLSGLAVNAAYGISGPGVGIGDVATDASGNTYVTGSYTGNITVPSAGYSPVTFPDLTSKPESFVVSYSATGGFNWYDEFENSAYEYRPVVDSLMTPVSFTMPPTRRSMSSATSRARSISILSGEATSRQPAPTRARTLTPRTITSSA